MGNVKGWSRTSTYKNKGRLAFNISWVDRDHVYAAGAALLDLKDPTKVIARTKKPVLEPNEPYEKNGDVNNVVFPTAAYVMDEKLFVYYGAADKVCCLATIDLENFLDHVLKDYH